MAVSNMSFSPYQPSWFQMHRHSDQASMGDLEEKWVLLTVSDKKRQIYSCLCLVSAAGAF